MKLNLLPTTVRGESRGKAAYVFSFILAAAGIGSIFFMKSTSEKFISDQDKRIADAKPQAERAVAYVNEANKLINDNRGTILNSQLAESMKKHADVYPTLLTEMKKYIPGWFRINSIQAIPQGESATTVVMTGVVKTQQQYADLLLAMLRVPDVVNVSRNGFDYQIPRLAALTPEDQTGRMRNPGDPVWPDDPIRRLELQIANATYTDFKNTGGFGTTTQPMVRNAMPGWSNVTVSVLMRKNIQSPNPIAAVRSTAQMWPAVDTSGGQGNAPKTNSTPTGATVAP